MKKVFSHKYSVKHIYGTDKIRNKTYSVDKPVRYWLQIYQYFNNVFNSSI